MPPDPQRLDALLVCFFAELPIVSRFGFDLYSKIVVRRRGQSRSIHPPWLMGELV